MAVPIGTVRMSYLIDPCDLQGYPINGGNHHSNADSAEDARATAERMLRPERYLGYVLGSVSVYGRELRLGLRGWETVLGGRSDVFTVTRADAGAEPVWMTSDRHCWDTTVMDYPERVHAMKSDGTCQCGNPKTGYGGEQNATA